MEHRDNTMSSAQVGVCPVCGGRLIESGDHVYCDTCDYDSTDPETWGEEAK